MSCDGWRQYRRDNRASKKRKLNRTPEEELEAKLGFDLFSEGKKRLGWLLTFASSSVEDEYSYKVYSCVDLYFVAQDGSSFKSKFKFRPYFYAATKDKMEMDVEAYLRRRFGSQIADIEVIEKEDLDLKNHLSGLRKSYLKLSFDTVQQLMDVKKDLMPSIERNKAKSDAAEAILSMSTERREHKPQDFLDCITDLREYDVPHHVHFAIDNDIRCGQWYEVGVSNSGVTLEKRTDLLQRAEVRICAFDIETTKLPLKFPDADYDLIMMISYMILRKNLLKYVNVREFAPEAEFYDACHSFILPNVICSYCNDCRDLDLCRDSALLTEEWCCAVPQSGQPYDREVTENALLQTVRQRERLYHLQDLVCQRCYQVKAAHLAEQCACAGSFGCKEDASEFRKKMQVISNIASLQKFQLLQECISWILKLKIV